MQQLVMEALVSERKEEKKLPVGYCYERFNGSEKDVADWKTIIMEPPGSPSGPDLCYQRMILNYPDCVPEKDIHFISNAEDIRVATITTITHADGSGYVHMVKAKLSERGKGLGHAMADYALRIFAERNVERVVLTTDDERLPAIKTYLDAGFLPVIYHDPDSDMEVRWNKILLKLNYEQVKRIYR